MTKNRIQVEEFLSAYWKAVDEGLTRDEFASRMGIKVNTVYQRVYELNVGLRKRGQGGLLLLPLQPRKSVLDRAAEVVGKLGGEPSQSAAAEEEGMDELLADILG